MAKKKYQIVGRVVIAGQGVLGLRVEAWDKDRISDDLVSNAVTGTDGSFQMRFDQSYFADLFLDSQPDLYFKVFDGDQLIKSTEDSVLWNVAAGKTEVVIELGSGQPKGDGVMPKQPGGKTPAGTKETVVVKAPVGGKGTKPGKGPKKDKTPKKGKGKKNGTEQYQPSGSDFVCVIISKKCALELATAISLALGFPVTPGKKKGKKKKGKDKKKGGKTNPKTSPKKGGGKK